MKNNNDKVFITIIISLMLIVLTWFPINHLMIKLGYKELQTTDNWTIFKGTKKTTIGKIDDKVKSIKTSLENRVTNYFPFYHQLNKSFYSLVINSNKLLYNKNTPIGTNTSNEYVFFDNENKFYYLVNNYSNEELEIRTKNQAFFYNSLYESNKNINLNLYIIPRYDQTGLAIRDLSNYTEIFKESLNPNINVKELNIENTEDYLNKFYKTDHHWNINGTYLGYQEIMHMLNKTPLELTKQKVNTSPYYGSLAKSSLSTLTSDDIYDFDINLDYKVTINNQEPNEKFKPRKITYQKNYQFYDYYVHYYNGQYGLIHYVYPNNDNNLLIIGDSYNWSIDYLIASHYKNTYVVNLRYDEYTKNTFNYKDFIKENNIDDVLFLYEGSSLIFDQYNYNISSKIVR